MKKIVALLTAVLMMVLLAAPAMADNYADWSGTVPGTANVTVEKYLVMNKESVVPEVTFNYELTVPAAAEDGEGNPIKVNDLEVAVPATDGKVQVYVGIGHEDITFAAESNPMIFRRADATTDGPLENVADENQKYVKKDIIMDFSGVTYTEPGIYRYYLQESSNNALIDNDVMVADTNKTWRTIDVYVTNNPDGVTKYIFDRKYYDTFEEAADVAIGSGASAEDVKTVSVENTLTVTEVIYEGKLTTAAPNQNPAHVYDPDDDFDLSRNLTGIASTIWTYMADNGDTYEYTWVNPSTIPGGEAAWEETLKTSAGQTYINRNKTTHLDDAYGNPSGQDYSPADYAEAVAMGATDAQIQGTNWTLTDASGNTTVYVYDDVNSVWNVTGTTAPEAVDKPNNDARAIVQITTGMEVEYKYTEAKDNEQYIDGELTTYTWTLTNTTDGTVTTFTFDSQNNTWVQVVTTNSTAAAPADAATPDNPIRLNSIKYSYAYDQELAAQEAAGYDISAAMNPNGAEAGNKNDAFVNEFNSYELTVAKNVTGNQGSKDKYFEFVIEIDTTDLSYVESDTTKYKAAGIYMDYDKDHMDTKPTENAVTMYDAASMEQANSRDDDTNVAGSQVRIGDDGKATVTVYLQAGQSATLKGIPAGTKYTVKESDAGKDGYTTTVTKDGVDFTDGTEVTIDSDDDIVYTNNKQGVIPTGVAVGIGGAVVLLGLVVAYIVIRRKTAVEED